MAYYPYAVETGARYVLTAPDGTIAVFNDDGDANYVGMLTDVGGLDSAEVRESAQELVEADGGTHGSFYFGRRPITMNGTVFGHTSVAARNARLDLGRRASMALRADATLTWKPSTRNENLITNPRAATVTTGWVTTQASVVSAGATLTRQTGVAPPVGTTTFQIVTTGSGSTNQGAASGVPVQANRTYSVSATVRRTAGTGTYEVFLFGPGVSTTLIAGAGAAAFTTYAGTVTPTGAGTLYVAVRSANSNTAAATIQFSDIMVSPGTNTTYKDGDTAGWFWQGDSGVSASGDFIEMMTTVRRQQPWREAGAWVKTFQLALVSEYAVLFSSTLHTATGTGVTVENRGNWPAFPLVTITGASTNPFVTINGITFKTTGLTLSGGEAVQFDFLNHTGVFTAGGRIGQAANRYIDFALTGWPSILGSQTVTLAGGGTLTSVQWRDTWA